MNALHTMLAAGFVQATPVLGESVTIGNITAIGFFSQADEKLIMEIVGYLDECDTICVLNVADWTADIPQVKETFVHNETLYSIRGKKTDLSAYVLALKMIGPAPGSVIETDIQTFTGDNIATFSGNQVTAF